MKNDEFLENTLKKISVNPAREEQIRSILKESMKKFGEQFPDYTNYRIKGSFKRYTNIRGNFDVDVNVIGKWNQEKLLKTFYRKVKKFAEKNEEIEIMREAPYYHAIPIRINGDVEVDFLAAIDAGSGIYLIPEGYQKVIRTAPIQFEEKLNRINKNTNGTSMKLIRLLKLWNSKRNKIFKSYQIEQLVCEIFKKSSITSLSKGLSYFFQASIEFLQSGRDILDEIKGEYVFGGLNREKAIGALKISNKYLKEGKITKVFPEI